MLEHIWYVAQYVQDRAGLGRGVFTFGFFATFALVFPLTKAFRFALE